MWRVDHQRKPRFEVIDLLKPENNMTGRSRLASIPLLLLSTLLAMVSASGQADAHANDFSPATALKLCNALGGSCSETR